ncbi:MAG: hypothetical protein ACRC0X_02760 [Brevinema sp.]
MTREALANTQLSKTCSYPAYRTKRLVHFFRAVSLFATPIRSSELGLRRRK